MCESTCDILPSSAANQNWWHSFGSSRRCCHSWRYQAAFATRQGIYIYIYIYMPDQLVMLRSTRRGNYIVCSCSFFEQFVIFKTCLLSAVVIIYVHFIHAEDFLLSTKSSLMHIAPWSEDDMKQLSNCCLWFLLISTSAFSLPILTFPSVSVIYSVVFQLFYLFYALLHQSTPNKHI